MKMRKTAMTKLGVAAGLLIGGLLLSGSLPAADLTVADGVVVKFGPDAQLVVRDRLAIGSGVLFTSQKDDTAGGQTGTAGATAAAGDWRGVRLEKSASAYGALTINDVAIRYAGAGNEAALLVRGWNPKLQHLRITESTTGLRLLDGASPPISGSSFLRNGIGLEADGGSAPVIGATQFEGNTSYAILNKTPATVIPATGNWWGHSSGPRDSTGNPQGLGERVSAGVDYGNYLTSAPLLNPSVQLAEPAPYFEQRNIALRLSCLNATEYRIAENDAFAGVPFQALTNGRATVDYTVSAGDGNKPISAQFRNAHGTLVSATLAEEVLIDTEAPRLTIHNPAAGSVISQPITVETTAEDASGIARVDFHLDGQLVASRANAPYHFAWNTDASEDGDHTLKLVAVDRVGRITEQSRVVTLSRTPDAPDTEGPQLSGIQADGAPLTDGATFTRNVAITFGASDRSGIARIELLLDGQLAAVAAGTGHYSALLDITGVADGSHTLTIRATDSLNNVSATNIGIVIAHAVPAAPKWTSPANGTTTRAAALTVAGTAQAGSLVQVFVNGVPAGAPVSAVDGRFSIPVTLEPGANQIQATATDQYGTSALSAALQVTLDSSVPASPAGLTATAQAQGKVRLAWTRSTDPNATGHDIYRAPNAFDSIEEAVKINSALITAAAFDDLPPQDAVWTYRVVALNSAGTPSLPTNAAQVASDSTAPRAVSIVYSPHGKTDPLTGRIGQGWIDLVLTTNEALQTTPYLAIAPEGGVVIPIVLTATGASTYAGRFLIDANTPAGTAHALFSARDAVGNRGTDIDEGGSLKIDTDGPVLSAIVLNPDTPINNGAQPEIEATFTFSKAAASTPQIKYQLSGPQHSAIALAGVTQTGSATYRAAFSLPADAGLAGPETLSFSFQAQDDLDNISTRVAAFNSFQVYQGNLPPLDVPFFLTAVAQPGGKVKLSWKEVEDAGAYQIYRQGPEENDLQPLVRASGADYIDQTPQDGTYWYAVSSVRQANGQEALSGPSAAVEVKASATAPGAPHNLTLHLTGQGIYASWQPPLASAVDSYNLYRAGGASISSIEGLTALKTRIKTPQTYDTSPSPTQGAYVVTAVDAAGNESAISNSAYLNASLLPVRNLAVEQIGANLPKISWSAPNGNVAGYLVYVGPDADRTPLTASPIAATNFTDTGYTAGERRYTVATVDANGVEMPRSITLPQVTAHVASGLPIQRGIMNRLQVQVTNLSAAALDGIQAVIRLPVNESATQFKEHKSALFSLEANQTRLLPVIVGGYAELPGAAQARIGVEISPVEGELVKIARDQSVEVGEGALVVGMATEDFTRGATGKVRLSIENTTDVDIELLTATANGANPSTELRFKILDADGNILATQPFQQMFGASIVTLVNGLSVARIPAGTSFVSDVFHLKVPASSPNSIRIRLEVDKLRYHSGQEDEVIIAGRGSEKVVSLLDTAYIGEVTDVEPISSFGDEDVLITGRALDRTSQAPLPNTALKLILNQQGFERVFNVLTDPSGGFTYLFKPTLTDAGLYKVSAVHPDITDRPEQKTFTIHRVTVSPTPYRLNIPKNYPYSIPFKAKAGAGTAANNLRFVLDAASQPTGQLPAGITVQLPAPIRLTERQTLNLPVLFTADNQAQPSGSLILDAISDEHAGSPLGRVRIDYTLSEAKPHLVSTPGYIETGLAQGGAEIESVTVRNNGLEDALNLRFSLARTDGSAAPGWVNIASQADGTLAVGASRAIDLAFTPSADVAEGVYEFRLHVAGDNLPAQSLNVYVSITQSGQGNVLFKASDLYTATVGKNGQLIQGLAGARITVQHEDVPSISHELITDSLGEAWFQGLPAGRYQFRARASNHQETGGRLTVKPGITVSQPIFLDYNLITVEWDVREITIEDRYDITLEATFETDVPAAVVVMQPSGINLPKMNAGDVYYGELVLTNHGLVRADNLRQQLPSSDAWFRYEFLVDVPAELEAKQRVTLPYRMIALQSLDAAASGANASGGGCYSYSNTTCVGYDYRCANGVTSGGRTCTTWFRSSNSTCPSGGSGGGGGWGGWGGGWGGSTGYQSMPGLPPCVKCDGKCCYAGGDGGGSGEGF